MSKNIQISVNIRKQFKFCANFVNYGNTSNEVNKLNKQKTYDFTTTILTNRRIRIASPTRINLTLTLRCIFFFQLTRQMLNDDLIRCATQQHQPF